MVKKILLGSCILLSCTACTSEITRLKETEYLRTHSTKAVVYPADVDKPAQEKSYVIPELPSKQGQAETEAPELLALPPRLVGVDASEDEEDEDEENQGSEDQTGETPEPVDEELLPESAE